MYPELKSWGTNCGNSSQCLIYWPLAIPSNFLITTGVSSACLLMAGVHVRGSLTSDVPIRFPLYTRCPHQSATLRQVSPSARPLTAGVPVKVITYTRCSHQSAPIHQMFLSVSTPPPNIKLSATVGRGTHAWQQIGHLIHIVWQWRAKKWITVAGIPGIPSDVLMRTEFLQWEKYRNPVPMSSCRTWGLHLPDSREIREIYFLPIVPQTNLGLASRPFKDSPRSIRAFWWVLIPTKMLSIRAITSIDISTSLITNIT